MNVLLLLGVLAPQQVLIATPRGQVSIPVMNEQGAAAVAAVLLTQPLGLTVSLDGSAAHVTLGDHSFDFDVGSPFVRYEGAAYPLVGAPYVARDTLFLPLHWLTDHLPRLLAGRYRWDPWLATGDRKSTRLNSSHTVIYTLSLHDALPISIRRPRYTLSAAALADRSPTAPARRSLSLGSLACDRRSEEHTSELQSHSDLHSFPTRRSSDLHTSPAIHSFCRCTG